MRKGFTLIEMLGVIVVLAVIGLITIPIVTNVMKESKASLSKSQEELIIRGAKAYANAHIFDDSFTVTVDKLMEEGYLEKNNDLKDKYTVKIKKQNGKFNFTVNKIGEATLEIDSTFVPQYYEYHSGSNVVIGQSYSISTWTQDSTTLNSDYYLGHDVSGSGSTRTVTASYACFILDDTQYCMQGKNRTTGTIYFTQNKALLGTLKDAGIITCSTWSTTVADCTSDSLNRLYANSAGYVDVGDSASTCCYSSIYGVADCDE